MDNSKVRFETGRVLAALPYLNMYLVRLHGDLGDHLAVALDESGDRRGGHAGGPSYIPGTCVFVAVFNQHREGFREYLIPHLILGSFAPYPVVKGNTNIIPSETVPDSPAGFNLNEVYRRLLENDTVPYMGQDRSFNRALDEVPGDFQRTTALSGYLHLSLFRAGMQVNPGCGISLNGLDNSVSSVCRRLEEDADTVLREVLPYTGHSLSVLSVAYSSAEGLGVPDGQAPFISADNPLGEHLLVPQHEDQQGFFRLQELRGRAVAGSLRSCVTDYNATLPDGEVFTSNAASVFAGTVQEEFTMDGRFRVQALKEILLQKTPYIAVPQRITPDESATPEEETPAEERDDIDLIVTRLQMTEEEYRAHQHLLLEEVSAQSAVFAHPDLPPDWKEPTREELVEVMGQGSATLPPLDDTKAEYTLSDLMAALSFVAELTPGKKVRLFRNSSVFFMQDDGGVIFGDGYGSELRMNRGRMTFASAVDMEFRPGRDLIEWVPRSRISKVRGRCETSVTNGSYVVKAEENVHMLSANGGAGSLILENRATGSNLTSVEPSALVNGQAVGSGILLKAPSAGVAMLGTYIYGGSHAPEKGKSKQGVTSGDCAILLDSGTAPCTIQGAAVTLQGSTLLSMQMLGAVTGLHLSQSHLAAIAPSLISLTSPTVALEKGSGNIQQTTMTRTGARTRTLTLPTASPQLIVRGDVLTNGSVLIKDNLLVEGSGAANGGFGIPERPIRYQAPATLSPAIQALADAVNNSQTTLQNAMLAYGVATEYGQRITDFAFPDSDSPCYNTLGTTFQATRWQAALQNAQKWRENAVAHPLVDGQQTMPYPGAYAYARSDVFTTKELTGDGTARIVRKPLSEYPINTST